MSLSSLLGDPELRQTFTVTHVQGLHARPCALLVKLFEPLKCEVQVQCGEHVVNGRSILGLLALAAGCHSKLTFTIRGRDANQALAGVAALFQTGFAAAYEERSKHLS